jgi:tetratricopeptide (TPR) repeat protein
MHTWNRTLRAAPRRRCRPHRAGWVAAVLGVLSVSWSAAFGADPEYLRAQQLLRDGRYQQVYDLLAPYSDARADDLPFNYLLARAALETDRAREAKTTFERILAADPDSIEAHLGLAQALLGLGECARAKIEFETVLRFDNLPPDLYQQAQIYANAARAYAQGKRLLPYGYGSIGIGRYAVNPTVGTNLFGGGDRRDTFYSARVGGGLNYELPGNYALEGSLDYRFKYYDNTDSTNDSDLRWRAAVSRALGPSNVIAGLKGWVSYEGDGYYRNDYGVFANWRYYLNPDNQLSLGAEYRRRSYPGGTLRTQSSNIGELAAGWTRSLAEGRASVSLVANGGYEWATQERSDGDSAFFGLTGTLNVTLAQRVGAFVFAQWQQDSFNAKRINYAPDFTSLGDARRSDNIYEIGAGVSWAFAPGWSLNPELIWTRDQSNILIVNYSATEVFVYLRKDF